MTMTKSDFEAVAEAINEAKRRVYWLLRNEKDLTVALVTLEMATTELATACHSRYRGAYSFNRTKFVIACGFPEA